MNLFLLGRPTDLDAFQAAAATLAPTYGPVALDERTPTPAGYNRDYNRVLLGKGREAWARARAALDAWRMFDLPWIQIYPERPQVAEGEIVLILARQPLGLWVRNAARIAWVIDDETGPVARYGFCYGTLPCHVEQGVERFQVSWDRGTDEVGYTLLAFSRPQHWLAKLGRPWARRQQRRFAKGSLESMRRAVET